MALDRQDEPILLDLDGVTIAVLGALAECNGCTPEQVAQGILRDWAREKAESAQLLVDLLERPSEERPVAAVGREKEYELRLVRDLIAAGFDARSQIKTPAGIADIVVYADDTPVVVIEMKIRLRARRELNHAIGQASAYARALRTTRYFAVAGDVAEELQQGPDGRRAVRITDAVERVTTLMGTNHAVSITASR